MSGRIVSLVGTTDSGDLVSIGLGTGDTISRLKEQRESIRIANGLWKKGPREIKLTELHMLSTNTAGGELKARLKF